MIQESTRENAKQIQAIYAWQNPGQFMEWKRAVCEALRQDNGDSRRKAVTKREKVAPEEFGKFAGKPGPRLNRVDFRLDLEEAMASLPESQAQAVTDFIDRNGANKKRSDTTDFGALLGEALTNADYQNFHRAKQKLAVSLSDYND